MKNLAIPPTARVLLVEDSQPIRQRLHSLVEESGHATVVGEAGTVATALARFYELQPDAVVLDLHLVEGSGYVVLKAIKQSRPTCTVIVLTNFATPETREHCYFLGADHFFEKSREFERVPEVLAGLVCRLPPGGRILIADNEVLVGKVLKQFLVAAGYDCTWVPDAAATRQALRHARFDLLIADRNLGHSGLLAELPAMAPGLPVILLTGELAAGAEPAAEWRPATASLTQPPGMAGLKNLVQEAIANHQVHRAVQRQWAHFQALFYDLNLHLAVAPQPGAANPGERPELECLLRALSAVVQAGGVKPAPEVIQVVQQRELAGAVRELMAGLAQTQRTFHSQTPGSFWARLAALMDSLELTPAVVPETSPARGN